MESKTSCPKNTLFGNTKSKQTMAQNKENILKKYDR